MGRDTGTKIALSLTALVAGWVGLVFVGKNSSPLGDGATSSGQPTHTPSSSPRGWRLIEGDALTAKPGRVYRGAVVLHGAANVADEKAIASYLEKHGFVQVFVGTSPPDASWLVDGADYYVLALFAGAEALTMPREKGSFAAGGEVVEAFELA